MDDALARTGAARGQREYTLLTARAFAHMPTAFDHGEIETSNQHPSAWPRLPSFSLPHHTMVIRGQQMRDARGGEMR